MRTHVDSDHVQRSWRAIEPAQIGANADIGEMRHEPLTVGFPDIDRDDGRKNTGEKGMQRAATVGVVSVLIALMVCASIPVVVMRMLVIGVESGSSCEGLRAGERKRDDARELGENKQGHQHMDKTADHPSPSHWHFRRRALCEDRGRQSMPVRGQTQTRSGARYPHAPTNCNTTSR
jgi:hypothetical protein